MTSDENRKPKSILPGVIAAVVAATAATTVGAAKVPDDIPHVSAQTAAPFYDDQLEYQPVPVPDPAPTHSHASAAPRPTPTATPTSKPRTTGTSTGRSASWAAGNWGRFPVSVERSAYCVAKHESWSAGLWRAIYRGPVSSTASGFAQWLDSTWRAQAKRAGIGTQYRRAYQAPPEIQAAVFAYQAQHHGLYPWAGTNCPGT